MYFQFYLGGISHPWSIFCAPDYLDHGVLIVGYSVGEYAVKLYDRTLQYVMRCIRAAVTYLASKL